MVNIALSPNDRSLLPRRSMSREIPGDAPSDEEAQDAVAFRKHPHFLILTTPTTPTTVGTTFSSRRRTQSLHSVLPEHLLYTRSRRHPNGYDSDPSDLSSEASDDGSLSHVPVPEQREPVVAPSQRRRNWPFRVILLLCAYVSWTTDSFSLSNSWLRSARPPQTTAAFSPQHGREVALPVTFPKLPLTETKKVYIPPQNMAPRKKRRPNLSHALPGNAPPVLGQKPLQRFVLDENDSQEPLPPPRKKSSLQWVASIALLWLVLETGIRQVRQTFAPLPLCFTPRQRLRYD
jgi:hypothetical protein